MGRHLSPWYDPVILVSEYPVLTAVNSPQRGHAISRAKKNVSCPNALHVFVQRKYNIHVSPSSRGDSWFSLSVQMGGCMPMPKFLWRIVYQIFLAMGLCSHVSVDLLLGSILEAIFPIWVSDGCHEGPRKKELATISHKFSFVLRPDKGKYHWLKNDVQDIKVDW